jgi:hypothetical protein
MMNGEGPSIERSTWLSAARCNTAEGENRLKISASARLLPISAFSKKISGSA